MRTVTVVGASLAGLYAARELRAQGFDGRLVVVGDEPHRPYDRPPLSKDFLTGRVDEDRLALTDAEDDTALGAEWLLGTGARALDPRERAVVLADGRTLPTDGVVIATGASARRLPGTAPTGVHTLRTLDDARALRAGLTRGARRVVVIGGGFVGAETAASCVALGHRVTVVEAAPLPLLPALGPALAAVCAALHRRGGAELITGTGVAALRGTPAVTGVELSDGRVLDADVVVVGIGAVPNTAWLAGSTLALRDGVLCDDGCVTALPQVVAVGDVARVGGVRSEHWTSATEQPRTAVANLLAGRTTRSARSLPYFWSDQYGSRIQFAGRRRDGDTVRITEGGLVDGAPGPDGLLALCERDGRTTAVLSVDRPRPFTRTRRALDRQEKEKESEIEIEKGSGSGDAARDGLRHPAGR
ncbi:MULTISPECIES: NAD(P)/FAD-dependent oxidoreductase [Streptomyces]|uniref:FAD-dependent oxidoreductase n=1 Tax=Streptomyces doudnae TaxID=3075536 RepID=A0ABD5EQS3_9ACTN|nr:MULTISPECIES: FAD-dependent oxidoreductase [unclassified Streptomyces]MDT0437048.1 FAD-dependent oxidoreductase [Streptomyces sp. DSM 41981]MYQ67960.1 FAD-dependent oxidoreductase [Streptomyces sp. SID4950]SCE41772.1 Reductase C-terminal [Streptomyces sp. SolWspMP-5a-2]